VFEKLRAWMPGVGVAEAGGPRVALDGKAVPFLDVPPVSEAVAAYIDGGMYEVAGWGINPATARLFVVWDAWQRQAGVSGALVELGVHEGKAAILLALLARVGEPVVLVDLFDRQDENVSRSGHGNRARFEANLARWAPKAEPTVVQANSLDLDFASVEGMRRGVRLAHIDAGHDFASLTNDLAKTEALLSPGGIVVIDDFIHTGFPEVNEACHAYFAARDTRLAPVAMGISKLVLAERGAADAIMSDLEARLAAPRGTWVHFHGQPCLCLDHH
jgi:hypothetical protein